MLKEHLPGVLDEAPLPPDLYERIGSTGFEAAVTDDDLFVKACGSTVIFQMTHAEAAVLAAWISRRFAGAETGERKVS